MAIFKTLLAEENWSTKYQFDGETPLETQKRVAFNLAEVEKQYGATDEDVKKRKDDFLKTLVKFVPEDEYKAKYSEEDVYTDLEGNRLVADGLKNTCGGRITANIGTSFDEATLLNCFGGQEKFLSLEYGATSFDDVVGEDVTVLTEDGWLKAFVKSFGQQQTQKVTFSPATPFESWRDDDTGQLVSPGSDGATKKSSYRINGRSNYSREIVVTSNHRWILADGSETISLSEGDVIKSCVPSFSESDLDSGEYEEGFIHGLIYGDGTSAYKYQDGDFRFDIRLCGQKQRYLDLFSTISYPPSFEGEPLCSVRSQIDLKSVPQINDPVYLRAFIDGWAATDGHEHSSGSIEIGSQDHDAIEWLISNATMAGYQVNGFREDSNMETNYGSRSAAFQRVMLTDDQTKWKVRSIEPLSEEDVYCAVVPGPHAFTLQNGLYTGNCFINGPVTRGKISYDRQVPNTDVSIPVELEGEDTPDNLVNILLTLLEQAETLKSEGGYGINFDFIRPRSTLIEGVGIRHPGVVAYMEIWDKVSEIIVRGDNDGYTDELKNYLQDEDLVDQVEKKMPRKGAMMGCLSVWHPDIEEFVKAKQEKGTLTKFNISVVVDDAFMEAVENDDFYDLHFDGKTHKQIKARELYDLITECTYNRNEPGILFYDNMQRVNPISYLGINDATNPCGEIPGSPDMSTVCLLGSVNLTQYVRPDRTFDWDAYRDDVQTFARMLENVNDLGNVPLPQYAWALENIRQYGMGINGLGSALYMMGIKYSDDEGRDFADRVCQIKEDLTLRTSALLAKERGPAPMYREDFLETYYFNEYCTASEDTKDLIRKYGVRNLKTTTNPPLGSSSVICDMVANAIEPVFSHGYERTVIVDKWPEGLTRDNVKDVLDEIEVADATAWKGEYAGRTWYYEPHNRGLCFVEPVRDYGYNWVLEHFPEDIENQADYLETAQDLAVHDHVAMQAVIQKNVNQSVSKTSNLPNDYDFEDFKDLYKDAWKAGLIGFTTYRAGTMEEVLSTGDDKKESSERIHADNLLDFMQKEGYVPNDADITDENVIISDVHLPDVFENGPTKKVRADGNKYYLHMSYLPNDGDYPIALWVHSNDKEEGEYVSLNRATRSLTKLLINKGVEMDLVLDYKDKIADDMHHVRLGKMVSMALRHNIKIPDIVAALSDIEGDYIASTLTAVRKFLKDQIVDGTEAQTKCVACDSENVIYESGCDKCLDCGHSGCS